MGPGTGSRDTGFLMATHCTCGSPLPEGASFCPRCGRPLLPGVGEPAGDSEVPAYPAGPSPSSDRPAREAWLQAAFLPALGAMFLRLAMGAAGPWLALFSFLVPAGAGYLTVRRFEHRNGRVHRTWEGCGLGALTGLLCFVPSFLMQVGVILVNGKEAVLGSLREQAEGLPAAAEFAGLLEDPTVFAMVIGFGLLFEAIALIGVSAAGGAVAVAASR